MIIKHKYNGYFQNY